MSSTGTYARHSGETGLTWRNSTYAEHLLDAMQPTRAGSAKVMLPHVHIRCAGVCVTTVLVFKCNRKHKKATVHVVECLQVCCQFLLC